MARQQPWMPRVSIPLRALDLCRPNSSVFCKSSKKFPYPSGRWTSVDALTFNPSSKVEHVFPYPSGRWTSVDCIAQGWVHGIVQVSIPLRALDLCRRIDTRSIYMNGEVFPYPSGRWTSVDNCAKRVRRSASMFPYPSGRWTSVDACHSSSLATTIVGFPYPSGR